jgi:hypothetical protein
MYKSFIMGPVKIFRVRKSGHELDKWAGGPKIDLNAAMKESLLRLPGIAP